jgi:hypothetical protein
MHHEPWSTRVQVCKVPNRLRREWRGGGLLLAAYARTSRQDTVTLEEHS